MLLSLGSVMGFMMFMLIADLIFNSGDGVFDFAVDLSLDSSRFHHSIEFSEGVSIKICITMPE